MFASSSSSSSSQELLWSIYNRRLLMHSEATSPTASTQTNTVPNNGFDANVVMVLSVLLCALVCSLGLNSIVRCALRCSTFASRNSSQNENENIDNHQVSAARLASTGIKKAALKMFPTVCYSADLNIPGLDTECVICLSEFAPGERVKLLPKCNHGFHVRCIDKWLNSHSSCPTCRHCLIETCQKIVGCTQANSSRETIINMAPLGREDMVHT